MLSLYENLTKFAKRSGFATLSDLCDTAGVSRQTMTELKKGRTKKLSAKTAEKLCAVLHISLDELYGLEKQEPVVSEDDIKFALFGGDSDITDEMYDEVKKFAQFVKAREKEKEEQSNH